MKNLFPHFAIITWFIAGSVARPATFAHSVSSHLIPPKTQTTQPRIAVAPVDAKLYSYDDIGSILDSMDWTFTEINFKDLRNDDLLSKFDIVFINCSRPLTDVDDFEIPNDGVTDTNVWAADHASGSLEKFVQNGGTLYASDQAYIYIDKAFPGYLNFFPRADFGPDGLMNARVVDPGLATVLNSSTLSINFDLGAWVPVDTVADGVKVYLTGDDIPDYQGDTHHDLPLAAAFSYGKGRVVFTSFHNQQQTSDQEKKLLNYLILVSTTEDLSSTIQDTVTSAGYPIQQEILGSINSGASSAKYTLANSSVANLAIGLNWQDGTLGLSVFKPDGSLYTQKEGSPPLLIEIPNAEAGNWSYEVNGVEIPFENYPFVIQIGGPPLSEATPIITPDSPTNPDNGPGNKMPMLYTVIGSILCLAILFGMAIIIVVFLMRKRSRKPPVINK